MDSHLVVGRVNVLTFSTLAPKVAPGSPKAVPGGGVRELPFSSFFRLGSLGRSLGHPRSPKYAQGHQNDTKITQK